MSYLIDILSCIMKDVFQLKPLFNVIAQEINRVMVAWCLNQNSYVLKLETTHT